MRAPIDGARVEGRPLVGLADTLGAPDSLDRRVRLVRALRWRPADAEAVRHAGAIRAGTRSSSRPTRCASIVRPACYGSRRIVGRGGPNLLHLQQRLAIDQLS